MRSRIRSDVPPGTSLGPMHARVWVVVVLLAGTLAAGCLDAPEGQGSDPVGARFDGPDRPAFIEGRAVVAVVDSGIDPYHQSFASHRTTPARDLLDGYPDAALPLGLTLDAPDYGAALEADAAVWDAMEEQVLYDVPGTNIIGVIGFGDGLQAPGAVRSAPGLDELGHGTAAAGMVAQSCPDCLLVAVEVPDAAGGRKALDWLAGQDWIDVVVYPARAGAAFLGARYGDLEGGSSFVWARQNVEAGQVAVVASGNGHGAAGASTAYTPARDLSYAYWTAGPDWVVTVGAVDPASGEASTWHTMPVDLVAQGLDCTAPHAFSIDDTTDFEGTSCSAPVAAGWFGAVLRATRDVLRDGDTGPRSDQRLVVPERLDDPTVTREDVTRALYLSAKRIAPAAQGVTLHDPTDPTSWTTGDGLLAPTYAGWGTHDDESLQRAVDLLTGAMGAPKPSAEHAAWFPVDQRLRLDVWGDYERGDSRLPYPAPVAGPVTPPGSLEDLDALYAATLQRAGDDAAQPALLDRLGLGPLAAP